ncbi:MAG: phosphatase PAP2 family protein [Lachnospiraceae bacterium]|nr:phosphatase PAP2 family protein [Lachnospiraceae bacterium]
MDFLHVLQELRTPFGEAFFQAMTWLGEELVAMAILGILYWCVHKEFAYRLAFSFFLSGIATQVVKLTLRVPRPWVRDASLVPVGTATETATGYSFPSGHTQTGTSLYGTFLWKAPKWWQRLLCAAAIVLLGFSRMYLGVHTPADVLAALGMAMLLTILINTLYDRGVFERHRLAVMVVVTGISFATLIYAWILSCNGTVPQELAADAVKAGAAGLAFGIGWYLETTKVSFTTKTRTLWQQLVKLFVGLIGVLVLKSGIKAVFGETLLVDGIRYFLVVIWVTYLYPLVIKKFHGGENGHL